MKEQGYPQESFHTFLMDVCSNYVVYRLRLGAENVYNAEVEVSSPSARDVLGIRNPKRIEQWFEPLHPEDRERVTRGTIHSTSTGEPFEQILRLYHLDKGDYIWLYCKATADFDSQGKPTHFNGMILDITQFKQAVQTLQDTSEELKILIQNLKQQPPQQKEDVEEKLNKIMERLKDLLKRP